MRIIKSESFASARPQHSYTYYHECWGKAHLFADGRVVVESFCRFEKEAPSFRWGEPMSIEEALEEFRLFDHNGAGKELRAILRRWKEEG